MNYPERPVSRRLPVRPQAHLGRPERTEGPLALVVSVTARTVKLAGLREINTSRRLRMLRRGD